MSENSSSSQNQPQLTPEDQKQQPDSNEASSAKSSTLLTPPAAAKAEPGKLEKNEASSSATTRVVDSEKIKSAQEMVVVNIDDIFSKIALQEPTTSSTGRQRSADSTSGGDSGGGGTASSSGNNNCMALLPITTANQLVPLALLGKPSSITDECPGGIMQLITGTNKVSPATETTTTTVGAVLMIIPKKSDTVCVNMSQDQENNCPIDCSQQGEQVERAGSSGGGIAAGATSGCSDHAVKPNPSYDSYEEVCRICHDNPSKLELISPCLCKGSMSKVHRTCLERWLGESAKNSCEICGYEYNTVRRPKYTGCRSMYQWIRHPLSASDTRNLFFDIACFFILTPLAAISSWLCVVGAQHYSFGEEHKRKLKTQEMLTSPHGRNNLRDASNATWTSVGLLSLTGTLLAAYYIWLFVAIKYHIQVWREWQQRNFIVTIVPFEDGCLGRPPQARPGRAPNPISPDPHNDRATHPVHPSHPRSRSLFRGSNNNNLTSYTRNFLRNHPGYTISETTLIYQAMYGSDSDTAIINDNLLNLIESSDDVIGEAGSSDTVVLPEAKTADQQNQIAPRLCEDYKAMCAETLEYLEHMNTNAVGELASGAGQDDNQNFNQLLPPPVAQAHYGNCMNNGSMPHHAENSAARNQENCNSGVAVDCTSSRENVNENRRDTAKSNSQHHFNGQDMV